jgi:hypothetical protein
MSGPLENLLRRAGIVSAVVVTVLALGLGGGCHQAITQVVVALRSDLALPSEADNIVIAYQPGDQAPGVSSVAVVAPLESWPVSLGFSSGGTYGSFSIKVQLLRVGMVGQMVVASRSVTAIRFVDAETRMVVLDLPRTCACQGTTCPSPEEHPECADLVAPALVPLDPAVAPRGSAVPVTPGGLAAGGLL